MGNHHNHGWRKWHRISFSFYIFVLSQREREQRANQNHLTAPIHCKYRGRVEKKEEEEEEKRTKNRRNGKCVNTNAVKLPSIYYHIPNPSIDFRLRRRQKQWHPTLRLFFLSSQPLPPPGWTHSLLCGGQNQRIWGWTMATITVLVCTVWHTVWHHTYISLWTKHRCPGRCFWKTTPTFENLNRQFICFIYLNRCKKVLCNNECRNDVRGKTNALSSWIEFSCPKCPICGGGRCSSGPWCHWIEFRIWPKQKQTR